MALGRPILQDALARRKRPVNSAGSSPTDHKPKPSREVRVGDLLQVKNDSGDFQVEVLVLSEMRGPAAVAQTLYRETEASRELRQKLAEERKAMQNFELPRRQTIETQSPRNRQVSRQSLTQTTRPIHPPPEIAESCIGVKDTACIDACPVDAG